jgi:predicted Zn-dependent protease with MMP-like domain
MALPAAERRAFDELLDEVFAALPSKWKDVAHEVRIVIDDRPSREMLRSLGMSEDEATELCGVHTGVPRTERGVAGGLEEGWEPTPEIELYREGIIAEAGGWQGKHSTPEQRDAVREQIRITLLHELGHELGLDEDDLGRLGYD